MTCSVCPVRGNYFHQLAKSARSKLSMNFREGLTARNISDFYSVFNSSTWSPCLFRGGRFPAFFFEIYFKAILDCWGHLLLICFFVFCSHQIFFIAFPSGCVRDLQFSPFLHKWSLAKWGSFAHIPNNWITSLAKDARWSSSARLSWMNQFPPPPLVEPILVQMSWMAGVQAPLIWPIHSEKS